MTTVESYATRLRAVPARPVLVSAYIECDDVSAWWELAVVFAEPAESLGWGTYWGNYEDAFGKVLLSCWEVLGRPHYEFRLDLPPEVRSPRDLEGADRACVDQLARALGDALGVPVWVEPRDGPYGPWWSVLERLAAEAGDLQAQLKIAKECLVGADPEAAIWFRMAANQGCAEAAWRLGLMYANGRGIAKDDFEAVNWYAQAAEAGMLEAQYNLAVHCESGRGVPRDPAMAVYWFTKAAEQGSSWAKARLARLGRR